MQTEIEPIVTPVSPPKITRRRYALCGLSFRAIYNFALPILGKMSQFHENESYRDQAKLVGIFDFDRERVREFLKKHEEDIPYYSQEHGVDRMIRETQPDVLLVAGPDYTHFEHILAGLRHNLDVIAEKPVVINCEEVKALLAAERESAGTLTVTHNYRYSATSRKLKEIVLSGEIGRITNVEFTYNLDTLHGSSYFFRWNRLRSNSGGLSIHKSVHHLDFLNWLVGSDPEMVFAFGSLNYYGAKGAHNPQSKSEKILTMAEIRDQCPYFQKHYASRGALPDQRIKPSWDVVNLPYDIQYPSDTYIYDDEIDIEDTYSAVVRYQSGASMTYSCNFSTPWEGYSLGINGTKGRIEACHYSSSDQSTERPSNDFITVLPLFGEAKRYPLDLRSGGHGGADPLLRHDLFVRPSEESLALSLPADSYAGAVAIAAGEAIWRSIKDQRPYTIKELLGEFYRS